MAAMGFIGVIGVGLTVSYHMVDSENLVQVQLRKQKVAYYAAQAGLAEARSMIRAQWSATGFMQVFSEMVGPNPATVALNINGTDEYGIGGNCNETKNGRIMPCLYRLVGPTEYRLRNSDNQPFPGITGEANDYYPEDKGVYFYSFFYDDDDDNDFTADTNRQFWVVSVGEVSIRGETPVRVAVRSLVTGPPPAETTTGYSGQKGGDSSKPNSTL